MHLFTSLRSGTKITKLERKSCISKGIHCIFFGLCGAVKTLFLHTERLFSNIRIISCVLTMLAYPLRFDVPISDSGSPLNIGYTCEYSLDAILLRNGTFF